MQKKEIENIEINMKQMKEKERIEEIVKEEKVD